jgi:hypothetical protein
MNAKADQRKAPESKPASKAATDLGHSHSIELKLRDVSQLFNSMDPSPFVQKDLDDGTAGSMARIRPGTPLKPTRSTSCSSGR